MEKFPVISLFNRELLQKRLVRSRLRHPPTSPHLTATFRLRAQNARLPADSSDFKVTGELVPCAVKVFLPDVIDAERRASAQKKEKGEDTAVPTNRRRVVGYSRKDRANIALPASHSSAFAKRKHLRPISRSHEEWHLCDQGFWQGPQELRR